MKISSHIKEYLVPALYLAAILGILLFAINRYIPKVGHDYGFFIPRMLDTYLHLKVEGLAIQWYTANFGAGTPAYPNPQYLQYSLPQFSMFVVNPWLSLMLSLVIYSVLGFACFYAFLRDEMGWISTACALAASFIIANGFFIEHAIVGHVGFQLFPLLGVLLFLAFTKRIGSVPAGILMGLVLASIVNQAGFVVIIIFILSLLIFLPLLYLIQPGLFQRKLFVTFLTGSVFAGLLSLSKVSAILQFMRFFPRVIADNYGQTYTQGIIGMVRQLAGFNLMIPYYLLSGRNIHDIVPFFHQGAGAQYGLWEMDMALSPGLLFLLIFGLGYFFYWIVKNKPIFSVGQIIALLVFCAGIWLATDLTLAQGWLYTLVKPLPILRSLHANVRFTAAFIFPLALLGALVFHRVFKNRKMGNTVAFSILSLLTLIMLSLYLFFSDTVHVRNFNLRSALPVYAKIDKGWNFTLENLADITDMQVFIEQNSNLASQDPMFGYEGEYFKPKAVIGPILQVNDGYFNMTNPASFVFPAENNLQPFDLFRADQKPDLEVFINHKQPDLKISSWQKIADVLTSITLVGSVIYLAFASIKGSIRLWQMNT